MRVLKLGAYEVQGTTGPEPAMLLPCAVVLLDLFELACGSANFYFSPVASTVSKYGGSRSRYTITCLRVLESRALKVALVFQFRKSQLVCGGSNLVPSVW